MRCSILFLTGALAASVVTRAGPVDFGLAQVNDALASRNLKWKVKYELNLEGPESYRIEPYGYGGGHVTGGDMRGLMYGLLEAADQIRATGRLALAHASPAIPLRGVRMFIADGDLGKNSEDYWRQYLQTLARSRLNRFSLIYLSANPFPTLVDIPGFSESGTPPEQRDQNLRMLRFISQTAAEYAVDFTLGFWETEDPPGDGKYKHDALLKLLAECPLIRSVEMRPHSADPGDYRGTIFKALHEAGHRVALEPRGALLDPSIEKAAEESGVALPTAAQSWPPGFIIDPPPGAGHEIFYWMWGRLAYDPKTKPPRTVPPADYRLAAEAVFELRNALLASPDAYLWPEIHPASIAPENAPEPRDFIATAAEAVRDRIATIASARLGPLEIADALSVSSDGLEKSEIPDYQLLAELARYHAHRLRVAYYLELFDQLKNPSALDRAARELKEDAWKSGEARPEDARALESSIEQRRAAGGFDPAKELPEPVKTPPRPQIVHAPVKIVAGDQPITLTIQINPAKDVRAVRLHYRAISAREWKTIERAPASLTFPIPAADLVPDSEFVYYFEILNSENSGWFEPDPAAAAPYHRVRVSPQ